MKCCDFIDSLPDLISGADSAQQRKECSEHMEECPPCVVYKESYEETIKAELKCCEHPDEPCEEVPEEMVRQIVDRCCEKPGSGSGT